MIARQRDLITQLELAGWCAELIRFPVPEPVPAWPYKNVLVVWKAEPPVQYRFSVDEALSYDEIRSRIEARKEVA